MNRVNPYYRKNWNGYWQERDLLLLAGRAFSNGFLLGALVMGTIWFIMSKH